MSLRRIIIAASALAGLGASALLLGPARIENLACRVASCPLERQLERLCSLSEEAALESRELRRERVEALFEATWPTPAGAQLVAALRSAPPGLAWEAFADLLAVEHVEGFRCPPLASIYAAPVAATRRALYVDGVAVLALEGARVPRSALDASGLTITPLQERLGAPPASAALRIGVHPELPAHTVGQLVYTAGLAGWARVELEILDAEDRARVHLPAYGPCPECLVEAAEVAWHPPLFEGRALLASLGRRRPVGAASLPGEPRIDAGGLSLTVGLEASGALWIAGRGSVLRAKRSGRSEGATLPPGAAGALDLDALNQRLEAVRRTYPDERAVLLTAEPTAEAGALLRLARALGEGPGGFELFLAIPRAFFEGTGSLAELLEPAQGVVVGTRAQLTAARPPVEALAAVVPALPEVRIAAPGRGRAPPPGPADSPAPPPARAPPAPPPSPPTPAERPAAAPEPPAPLPAPSRMPWEDAVAAGSPASPADIARALQPYLRGVQACYETALRHDDRLKGKVVLNFDILRDGRVGNFSVEDESLGSKAVTRCIVRRARNWRLPPPAGGAISVAYPVIFTAAL